MRRLWQRLIDVLRTGENLDLYATVAAAVIVMMWNLFGVPDPGLVSSITLAVLGLLAVGLLANRSRLERLLRLQSRQANEVLLTDFPNMTTELERSSDIWISGQNLRRTAISFCVLFGGKLEKGAHIRILLVDPDGIAPELAAKRLRRSPDVSEYREEICQSLRDFHRLTQRVSERGQIELRVVDYIPPFGLFILDAGSSDARALVEMYPYKTGHRDMPKLYLTNADDVIWFEFFKEQYEILWNAGTCWHPAMSHRSDKAPDSEPHNAITVA